MKKNKMKKFVSIVLLSSFLFSKISFGSFQNIEDNTMEKEYVLITETANGHNATKAKLTSYEADKL